MNVCAHTTFVLRKSITGTINLDSADPVLGAYGGDRMLPCRAGLTCSLKFVMSRVNCCCRGIARVIALSCDGLSDLRERSFQADRNDRGLRSQPVFLPLKRRKRIDDFTLTWKFGFQNLITKNRKEICLQKIIGRTAADVRNRCNAGCCQGFTSRGSGVHQLELPVTCTNATSRHEPETICPYLRTRLPPWSAHKRKLVVNPLEKENFHS